MSGRLIVVTAVGGASGSKAAAAALACAGSELGGAGLLVDVGGRSPRPTLVASNDARRLEERLTAHLPKLRAASRGQTCHLGIPDQGDVFEQLRAALPLARDSVAVVHLPPAHLQGLLAESGIRPTAVLLCADLGHDRPLAALVARDLVGRGLRVKILREPLAWVAARRALFGVLAPAASGALPASLLKSLLESQISAAHACYSGGADDTEIDPAGAAQPERRGDEGAGRGGELCGYPERQAGR